ncbi:31641_t:CDS:2, partial [Racocetra persica]
MGQSLKKLSKNGAPKNEVNEKDRKHNKDIYLKPLSVLEAYRFIQGRKFRLATNVTLTLPSDNEEAIRFNDSIKLLKQIFGSNYSAPVTKLLTCGGARVLEIGTFGGSWLNEMSIKFPMSIFLGLDVSTVFNPDCLPENSAFLEHNYHDGIPFPDDVICSFLTFDYVYQQSVSPKFRESLFDNHLNEICRVLKPGGWIEIYGSPTNIVNAGPATEQFILA